MTPLVYFVISAIVTPISLLSVMTEFKDGEKNVLTILIGTLAILGINLILINWIPADQRRTVFPFTILIPVYGLFSSLTKSSGPRFFYTYVFCLSIAVILVSLEPYVYLVSQSLIWTILIQAILITLILNRLLFKVRPLYLKTQVKPIEDWLAYSMTPFLALTLFFLIEEDLLDPMSRTSHPDLKLILFLILLVAHVLIFMDFQKQAHLALLKDEKKLLEALLEESRQSLVDQLDKHRAIQLVRHDFHHHLSVLSAAAHAHNLDAFDAYINTLRANIDKTAIHQYCAHFSINALLSIYLKKADDAKIAVSHRVMMAETVSMDVIDLAMILANAIENAINACLQVEPSRRYLTLWIDQDASALTIRIENPYRIEPLFKDGMPITRVPNHGHGTQGIKMLAEKYEGWAHFSAQKGRFIVIVQLPA